MRYAGNAVRWALAVLLGLAGMASAFAQDAPALRVAISTSGRAVLDGLLDSMVQRAGIGGQLAVQHIDALRALRDFCRNDKASPALVLVTRHMQGALASECSANGASDIGTIELARNPLILAVRSGSVLSGLTSRQIYLAVAREVPFRDGFSRNTAVRWSDVDPALPAEDIRFQLPMRDEGSRSTFDIMVLQSGCRDEPAVKQVYDAQQRTVRCITTRTDRVRELPRAQSAKALLEAPVGTVGVLTQRELAEAGDQLVALTLDGLAPTPEAVRQASYDFSSSFWLYAKRGRPEVERLVQVAQSETLIGPAGPLASLGVMPIPADEREAQRLALVADEGYGLVSLAAWFGDAATEVWTMFGLRAEQPLPAGVAESLDFTRLMDIAGYQVTGVQSSIGIIPDANMTFGMAREMSDADHLYLDRLLRRDALARPGAIAAIQRRIIRSIMDVREVGGFEVSKVEIDFLPLPKVSLTVTPRSGGGGGRSTDHDSVESE